MEYPRWQQVSSREGFWRLLLASQEGPQCSDFKQWMHWSVRSGVKPTDLSHWVHILLGEGVIKVEDRKHPKQHSDSKWQLLNHTLCAGSWRKRGRALKANTRTWCHKAEEGWVWDSHQVLQGAPGFPEARGWEPSEPQSSLYLRWETSAQGGHQGSVQTQLLQKGAQVPFL